MSLSDYEDKFEKRPFRTLFVVGALLVVTLTGISVVASGMGFFTNAAEVASKEFKPEAMLRKYEWFIDAAQQIEAKKANVTMYQSKISRIIEMDSPSRQDNERLMLWEQELIGVRANYNALVAEYNAQSSKFNWASFDTQNIQTKYEAM